MDPTTLPSNTFKQKHSEYGVVTLHRPSNVDDREIFERIMGTLANISETLPLIFPIHPRTRKNMDAFGINPAKNIHLVEPLSYMAFLNLWKDAKVVLTDSGGLQEETTALGIPCLTLRDNTERPITITEGTNELVGTSREAILEAFGKIIALKWKQGQRPKFWDGKASERIVEILKA